MLTRKEFGILEMLLAADGAVVSAEELLEHVWDVNADPFSNIVSVTMTRLRRKLGDPPLIETVVGKGYTDVTRPRLTIRAQLTLLYTGLFVVCGAIVVAVSYVLVAQLGTPGRG